MVIRAVASLIAYDCGAQNVNISSISLLEVGPCDITDSKPVVTQTYIRLLQLSRYASVHVKICRVSIDRSISHCGMHSHSSAVYNGEAEYIEDVSYDTCQQMHGLRAYQKAHIIINNLAMNQTTHTPLLLSGSLTSDGNCQGASFADPFGSWSNVVVQAKLKITIEEYYTNASPDDDRIYLRSGVQCTLSAARCIDDNGGRAYWEPNPHKNCEFDEYDVLYHGDAQRIYDNKTISGQIEEVYAMNTTDITVALAKRSSMRICGVNLIRTEHPKLFIMELSRNDPIMERKKLISPNNLDIFAYVNSKFVYLEKHMRQQLSDLYVDIMRQKCELERQVIENSLTLAHSHPAEFALKIMKEPGYMAIVAGEAIHIIKCVPVPVSLAREDECYEHLPVKRMNHTMFITPKTHILLKQSPKVDCNSFIPLLYKIGNSWIKVNPAPDSYLPPQILQPLTHITWKYQNADNLAATGLYSSKDLEKLQRNLLHKVEQTAIIDGIARGSVGEKIMNKEIQFSNFFDEKTVEKIAERATTKLCMWLTSFGTFSAGAIGLFIILKGIKFTVDTIIH